MELLSMLKGAFIIMPVSELEKIGARASARPTRTWSGSRIVRAHRIGRTGKQMCSCGARYPAVYARKTKTPKWHCSKCQTEWN